MPSFPGLSRYLYDVSAIVHEFECKLNIHDLLHHHLLVLPPLKPINSRHVVGYENF